MVCLEFAIQRSGHQRQPVSVVWLFIYLFRFNMPTRQQHELNFSVVYRSVYLNWNLIFSFDRNQIKSNYNSTSYCLDDAIPPFHCNGTHSSTHTHTKRLSKIFVMRFILLFSVTSLPTSKFEREEGEE